MEKIKIHTKKKRPDKKKKLHDYQTYPPNEDIYRHDKEESDIDPEDIYEKKGYPKKGMLHEKEFDHVISGRGLDVPGSELDDDMEDIGSEDEENNYYSQNDDNFDELEDILER